ncbi:hypothetical protein F4811DRAFT_559045 [Daldinia bambusicola]|nr:hypothetical protein F4811DRAFT_559045 [Daldinia bambusicola]
MDRSNSSVNTDMVEKFLHIPCDKRREYLRPVLTRMYVDENNTLKRISERMKEDPDQCRAHFRRWRIKKSTTTKEKNTTISVLGKRLRQDGISTCDVTINQGSSSKNVDKKQLKLYIHGTTRRSDPLILHPGIFLRHDIPYAARIHGLGKRDISSPPSTSLHIPSNVTVRSPEAMASSSRPQNGLSPTMQPIKRKVLLNRPRLFLDGKDQGLVAELTADQQESLATWLHDFWMCSFMTVKYWGRGPEIWTQSLIKFKSFAGMHPSNEFEVGFDLNDESARPAWRETSPQRKNQFSSMDAEDLPFAAEAILKTVQTPPDELKAEAFVFAIRSRISAIDSIFPFHVAARYLDGAKTCCLVMDTPVNRLQGFHAINVRYINNFGFTVLDLLFISILRSHSKVSLGIVCGKLAGQSQYARQDVDPCGRWDVDSPCIRQLYTSGGPTIPHEWKHIFCHTMPGENIFGMICCLVCLIAPRADPCLTAEVSIVELLGDGSTDGCQHPALRPAELASKILHRGWEILISILQLEREEDKSYDCDGDVHDLEDVIVYCANPKHGHIWAAIQAELLTYRRLNKIDNWLSPNFDMEKLKKGLEGNDEELLRKFAQNPDDETGESKLRNYSNCGYFYETHHAFFARREEACNSYYANLDGSELLSLSRWSIRIRNPK